MVLTWSLSQTDGSQRASSKAKYDFRLDEQDWEKVCWGRLPKAAARSPAHQLSRRAKWAAVLWRAASPEGGGWAADFAPEDMTPQRLQALARVIDQEFFQGTFHREVTRRSGRPLSYSSGDIVDLHGIAVPRGDAVMAAAPPPSPLGGGCSSASATAGGGGFVIAVGSGSGSGSGTDYAKPRWKAPPRPHVTAATAAAKAGAAAWVVPHPRRLQPLASQPLTRARLRPHPYPCMATEGCTVPAVADAGGGIDDAAAAIAGFGAATSGSELGRCSEGTGQRCARASPSAGAGFGGAPPCPHFNTAAEAVNTIRSAGSYCCGSSSPEDITAGSSSSSGGGVGRGGCGGGCPGSAAGRWGWLQGVWCRLRRRQRPASCAAAAAAASPPVAAGSRQAVVVAPSATYTHSLRNVTFWRQVWSSYSPSVSRPMRLDGVACVSRLSWLAHTLGHEMLHALLFSLCGEFARHAPRNMSLEGHGHNFLMLNWYVLGHRGYTYNPRGWLPPPPLPFRL